MYQNIISVAHLKASPERGKWGQLFNASSVLAVFVTKVCSNKPRCSVSRGTVLIVWSNCGNNCNICLLCALYQSNQAITRTGRHYKFNK